MSDEQVIADGSVPVDEAQVGLFAAIVGEICGSYINIALVVVIAVLLYKIVFNRSESESQQRAAAPEPELPRLRRDFTIQELKPFNGTQEDGRVLIAINGTVYDVTKGKRFYGPGGPYAVFAGRDASRGFATFSVTAADDDKYDDLSDLSKMELDSVKEWEMQFTEKYLVVGRLLKPGEEHNSYSDEEDDETGKKSGTSSVTNVDAHGESPAASDAEPKPKAE